MSVNSEDENRFLASEMKKLVNESDYHIGWWTSGKRVDNSGTYGHWRWGDDQDIWEARSAGRWQNWDFTEEGNIGAEPNDVGGNEDCIDVAPDGTWNDYICSREERFICESLGEFSPFSS